MLISENMNLFRDNITQNDLLSNNDDIYISRYGLNLQTKDIMNVMKYSKHNKKIEETTAKTFMYKNSKLINIEFE